MPRLVGVRRLALPCALRNQPFELKADVFFLTQGSLTHFATHCPPFPLPPPAFSGRGRCWKSRTSPSQPLGFRSCRSCGSCAPFPSLQLVPVVGWVFKQVIPPANKAGPPATADFGNFGSFFSVAEVDPICTLGYCQARHPIRWQTAFCPGG